MEQKDKKAKRKSLITKISIFLIMVAISIATSSINLEQMAKDFILSFFYFAAGDSKDSQSTDNQITVKGEHVQIRANEIYRARQIFEILDLDNSSEYATEELKKVKTLAYYGEKAGYSITSSDIDQYIDELKDKLKDKNEFKYNAMVEEYGSEKEYWKVMRNMVKEELLYSRTLEEKKTSILKQDENADIDKKLNEYIENLVGMENFQ